MQIPFPSSPAVLAILLVTPGLVAQSSQNVVLLPSTSATLLTDVGNHRKVLLVDFDSDGDNDLFSLRFAEPNMMFRNDSGDVFVADSKPGPLLAASNARSAVFGDIDADGDLDGLIATSGEPNRLFRNIGDQPHGKGRFVAVPTTGFESLVNASFDAVFGDLDGNGTLDLAVANRLAQNDLFFGNGNGTFVHDPTSAFAGPTNSSRDLVLSDLDLDGDLDIVVANSNYEDNAVYVNQGGAQGGLPGDFALLTADPIVSDGGFSFGLAVADLDADGRPDVAVANRLDTVNFLYRNLSSGSLVAFQRVLGTVLDGDLQRSYDVAFADVDGDGDIDVLVANALGETNALYLGTGTPWTFDKVLAGPFVTATDDSRSLAIGRLRRPGSLPEVAVGNALGQANVLYRNLGVQWLDLGQTLAGSAGLPRLTGHGNLTPSSSVTLALVNAAPSAPFWVASSLGVANQPFHGGVLVPNVAPGIGRWMGPFSTDGVGQANVPAQVPASLMGATSLFFQAAVRDGAAVQGTALSNGLRGLTLP